MEKEAKHVLTDARKDASGERALLRVLDMVTKTESLALCQHLLLGVDEMAESPTTFSRLLLLQNVSRIGAIPDLSEEKAEYIGYTLGGLALAVTDRSAVHKALARTTQGHPMVLLGLAAFMEDAFSSVDPTPFVACFQNLVERALAGPTSLVVKQAIAATWVRLSWRALETGAMDAASRIVQTGVRAVRLLPLDSSENCAVALGLLRGLADVAPSLTDPAPTLSLVALLVRLLPHVTSASTRAGLGMLLLLESLVSASDVSVVAAIDGEVFVLLAFFLATLEHPTEQTAVLRLLRVWLTALASTPSRSVVVESLFAPVLALMTSARQPEASTVLALLQTVQSLPWTPRASSSHEARLHPQYAVASLLQELATSPTLGAWLAQTAHALYASSDRDYDPTVVLAAATFLFESRSAMVLPALTLARACVAAWPMAGRLLVPSLVYVLSRATNGSDTQAILTTLVSTARDAECMKTLLRTVKALSATHPSTALRVLYQIWTLESRVYSRLEQLLSESHDDTDAEWPLVQLYTIYELCGVRGDLGLNFIATVQARLESHLPSLAAVALACVRSLCVADCLDFSTACKILASKLKKKRYMFIVCKDHVLFHVELCHLYAVGGSILTDTPSFLTTLWDATAHEDAQVRLAAYTSLHAYPLHLVGLKARSDTIGDDEADEQAVEAQLQTVLTAMETETDDETRAMITTLLQRVGKDEATQPRKRFVAERTSGAATRAMANVLPKPSALVELYKATIPLGLRQALGGAVLTSFGYVPLPLDDAIRKRKEKHLKHLDNLLSHATNLLSQLEDEAKATSEVPLLLAHLHGWDKFLHHYVALLRDVEALRGGLDDGEIESLRRAALHLLSRWEPLVCTTPNVAIALGVLARLLPSELHVLGGRIVEVLLRALSKAMQAHAAASIVADIESPSAAILGLGVALQGALSMHETRVDEVVEKLRGIAMSEAALAPTCLIALGHILPAIMQHGASASITALWHWLLEQLLATTLERQSDMDNVRAAVLTHPASLTLASVRRDATAAHAIFALSMASEGCMAVEEPTWLLGLYHVLLQLAEHGVADAWSALPPVLLHCVTFELLGWTDVDDFVAKCQAAVDQAVPQALVALPYLLCRTTALGHSIAQDVPSGLHAKLEAIASDAGREFDASARSYATLALANLLGTGLAIDGKPTVWKGLLVDKTQAEAIVSTLQQLCALCPVQRVRVHAAWALGALSALSTASESFQIKSRGLDAGLQLPTTTATYKLLDKLRQCKHPNTSDAHWVASSLRVLSVCHVPTFQYATLLLRFWNARLGSDVSVAGLAFAIGHCGQDPSLLSFLLDLAELPRFRPLPMAVQLRYMADIPILAKLIAPPQLDTMLSHVVAAMKSPEYGTALVSALAACSSASTPARAIAATVVSDTLFKGLVALRPPIELWRELAKAMVALDAKKGKTALIAASEAKTGPLALAGCVALTYLFEAGGCSSKDLQAIVLWLAAGHHARMDVELVVSRTATSAASIVAAMDKWWWLHNVLHWIGVGTGVAAVESDGLCQLLSALCLVWGQHSEDVLFLHSQSLVSARVLPTAFVDVFARVSSELSVAPTVDLMAYVQQLCAADHGSVWGHMLRYGYTLHGGVRLEASAMLDTFCDA
ncbi:hypothetical protein SPRG_09065 [Saprolegnia parasitica CBS 223.65]|uniref:DUF3730 domain-containing protein n=1 Tax=Saprolegnia parasitica (strain CBS 223.65) TaxID=695850 RepID=A0A067C5I9_SAPPC|nr:hypothetical protein SPRG_09065 [Saprolegnia parasitica CBS 223.65]KDO25768.1 hypothetical protein SPRG_09065 [Saprolegnia parasitica CBS 223.65]|eukprot:XP_012203574.1 hypothetical protein SPRG_09065 [Saprolegnia parasitica CBS 223.65]